MCIEFSVCDTALPNTVERLKVNWLNQFDFAVKSAKRKTKKKNYAWQHRELLSNVKYTFTMCYLYNDWKKKYWRHFYTLRNTPLTRVRGTWTRCGLYIVITFSYRRSTISMWIYSALGSSITDSMISSKRWGLRRGIFKWTGKPKWLHLDSVNYDLFVCIVGENEYAFHSEAA